MKTTFTGADLEDCLRAASSELNIPEEKIVYDIIEEKKGLFKRSMKISVNVSEKENHNTEKLNDKDGSITVKNGRIIVKNPAEGGEAATIVSSPDIRVSVNGETVNLRTPVYESSSIECYFTENIPQRFLDIKTSDDKIEAYITIKYVPVVKYCLKDCDNTKDYFPESCEKEIIMPDKYYIQEIREQLTKMGIVYGIIESNLNECVEKDKIENMLIAKGNAVTDDEDDTLEIKFSVDNELRQYCEDKSGNVDFKSVGSIEAVHKGDIICIKHDGSEGKDGTDVFGNEVKRRKGRRIRLKASHGCILRNGNIIVSEIDGKPCIRNSVFYVYKVHELNGNVDLKTGNIDFLGDIAINGEVKEGMKVQSGNSIHIKGGVERSEISAKGDIIIDGNIISSSVTAGGQDVIKLKQLNILKQLNSEIGELVTAVEEVKKFNLLGYDRTDGEIIKVLIENKYKQIPKLCLNIITGFIEDVKENKPLETKILQFIKCKLAGIAPLSIKNYGELDELLELLKEKIFLLEASLSIPVNVKVSYAQDSNIISSGDIIVSGKGIYVSEIIAQNKIEFLTEKSVIRGGSIRAGELISCRIIGSTGGVTTRLEVSDNGQIYADIAYSNSLFAVGNKEYRLDTSSRKVHVYLNDNKELTVDKFIL